MKASKMIDYNIVSYCRLCKKRFVSKKSEWKTYFCDKCQAIAAKPKK